MLNGRIITQINMFFNIDNLVKSNFLPDILKCLFKKFTFSKYVIENEINILKKESFAFTILYILPSSTLKSILCCFSKVIFFIILLSLIVILYLKPTLLHSYPNFSRCPTWSKSIKSSFFWVVVLKKVSFFFGSSVSFFSQIEFRYYFFLDVR